MKTNLPEKEWDGRFNEEQYDLLVESAKQGNMKKWNQYRRSKRNEAINLEGADLSNLDLQKGNFQKVNLKAANLSMTNLTKAILSKVDLSKANLYGCIINNAEIVSGNLEYANLSLANLDNCDLRFSNLHKASLHQSSLNNTNISYSNLEKASLNDANLNRCILRYSNLKGTELIKTSIEGSNFEAAITDGETIIWGCYYDRFTDFTGVGLTGCRIEPLLVSSFQCNIRRLWWASWFKEKIDKSNVYLEKFKASPIKNIYMLVIYILMYMMTLAVKFFWWITDYGSSTIRLLETFLVIAVLFSMLYGIFPQLTNDVILNSNAPYFLKAFRCIYFSIVIMTSVGFGDISANKINVLSHVILSIHALLGFVLLGAFLVRLGILFQGEFPVSDFRKREEDK